MFTIRREEPEDRDAIHAINRRAFETGAEANLIDALRGVEQAFVSLVAEQEGELIGHILFTPVSIGGVVEDTRYMGLAPVAVLPEYQKRGAGSELVRAGLQACREAGTQLVFVLGHPGYYPRFGFQPVAPLDLYFQDAKLDPYFFVLELAPGALQGVHGAINYHSLFNSV